MHCADCGTKYSNGVCPNCHEEAFIFLTQADFLPPVRDEFLDTVERQLVDAEKQRKKF